MLVLRFFRFLLGYIRFTARGGFPERFINLCRRNNILLWELKSENSVLSACTDCSGYKKIRSVARKSGMKVRISRKHGLPFFLMRHSRRIGVLIGVCFCVASIMILSTRIWSIDVTGNVRIPEERIIEIFENLGVKRGAAQARIDIKSTEIAALRELPELSWLNINLAGSAARIEVRETVETPKIDYDKTPTDIVAARDGQIVLLRPFSGTGEQKIGNAVLKGDPLISGVVENKDLTVSFCRSKGYVVARTTRIENVKQSAKLSVRSAVRESKKYIAEFLFFSVPLGRINAENAYRNRSEVFINGVTLPVGLTECREIVFEEKQITLNAGRQKLAAALDFLEQCAEDFRYLKVENAEINEVFSGGVYSVSGKFTCLENIGKEAPMNIEEG